MRQEQTKYYSSSTLHVQYLINLSIHSSFAIFFSYFKQMNWVYNSEYCVFSLKIYESRCLHSRMYNMLVQRVPHCFSKYLKVVCRQLDFSSVTKQLHTVHKSNRLFLVCGWPPFICVQQFSIVVWIKFSVSAFYFDADFLFEILTPACDIFCILTGNYCFLFNIVVSFDNITRSRSFLPFSA